jgi:NAD(P)-dependent dehydrogenase (short-subunit alcohol dehydrogenase family)
VIGLEGKRALVTGGTYGIGLGIAEAMLQAGARVAIASRKPPKDDVKQRLESQGEVCFLQADLSVADEARRCVRDAFNALEGLDALVNNAGSFFDVDFMDLTEEHFARTFDLNVRGYFLASQEFARVVGQRDFDAAIICVGSSNSIQAEHGSVLYDTSKGAIFMLMRSMAVSLGKHGIRVNGLGPGLIRTPLSSGGLASVPGAEKLLNAQMPLGRIGEIEDCGGAAVFLASDAAKYITGHMLYVDGGLTALQAIWELPEA